MTWQSWRWLMFPVLLLWGTTGCGSFMARRLVQAPNTYPTWFDYEAPVALGFSPKFLTNFPRQFLTVSPPPATLCYRVIEPADYRLRESATNWLAGGRKKYEFLFHADLPAPTNQWTAAPRGTVILLHGYGLAQFSLAPWALRLAQAGWRCVLVDLRGHGMSTGKQIYFGLHETNDLSQLLDQLDHDGRLQAPVAAIGESYGAALALRWKGVDPRVRTVVSIAPYGSLSNAVMNIRGEYTPWIPRFFVRAGLRQLPGLLHTPAAELDSTTELARCPVAALFVAGTEDRIAPLPEVRSLRALAASGSELIVVPDATHESLAYFMDDLIPPVLAWLSARQALGETP